jgi:hypothetical protein
VEQEADMVEEQWLTEKINLPNSKKQKQAGNHTNNISSSNHMYHSPLMQTISKLHLDISQQETRKDWVKFPKDLTLATKTKESV